MWVAVLCWCSSYRECSLASDLYSKKHERDTLNGFHRDYRYFLESSSSDNVSADYSKSYCVWREMQANGWTSSTHFVFGFTRGGQKSNFSINTHELVRSTGTSLPSKIKLTVHFHVSADWSQQPLWRQTDSTTSDAVHMSPKHVFWTQPETFNFLSLLLLLFLKGFRQTVRRNVPSTVSTSHHKPFLAPLHSKDTNNYPPTQRSIFS